MNEENLINTIQQLMEKGYVDEITWHQDHLHVAKSERKLFGEDFFIDAAYRFECSDKDEDCSAVFAISSPKSGVKGLLVDYFDQLKTNSDNPLAEKLIANLTAKNVSDDQISRRYDMRKIFKEEFDHDPSRFELRVGYPDFPKCPFGNTFKMLGYDKVNSEYVWLVTSIIKDKRLTTVNYK